MVYPCEPPSLIKEVNMKPKFTILVLLIAAALIGGTFVSAHVYVPDFTSKYSDPNLGDVGTGGGQVYVTLLSQGNPMESPLVVYRVETSKVFVNCAKVDAGFVNSLSFNRMDNETIDLGYSGHWDSILSPGTYIIELVDGDRGDPEYAMVNVVLGGEYHIKFLGHAASSTASVASNVVTKSPITIICADYVGVWNSGSTPGKNPYGNGGKESVVSEIQGYLNANPTVTSFNVYAQADNLYINGNKVHVGDPAYGWVKTLDVIYSYKDNKGRVKFGGFLIAENDAKQYNDPVLKFLPEIGTIAV
jgi:hypothetical protein